MIFMTIKFNYQPGILQYEVNAISPVLFCVSEPMFAFDEVS